MGSRKMILIIIGLLVLFFLFLHAALNQIQTVDLDIRTAPDDTVTDELTGTAEAFLRYGGTPFIRDITIDDMGLQVLFVDHLAGQAVLARDGTHTPVDYQALDRSVIYCNQYYAYSAKQPTLIVNCDPILGDAAERAIIACYQYELCDLGALDPGNINYFETLDEDERERFYRYQMIESLKDVYFEGQGLDAFRFYYQQWCDHLGQAYHEILDYDYYDGLKAYIEVKVRGQMTPNYDPKEYIASMKNEYGVYDKAVEYRLMGLLWCLVAEGEGQDIFNRAGMGSDQYQKLLDDTPLGSINDDDDWHAFYRCYQLYMDDLVSMAEKCQNTAATIQPRELSLTAESYGQTIQVGESRYIYLDYIARDDQMEIIQKNCMLAKIQAYNILYYAD
jgi:hypothetical protein